MQHERRKPKVKDFTELLVSWLACVGVIF